MCSGFLTFRFASSSIIARNRRISRGMMRFAVPFVTTLMLTEVRRFALTAQYPGTTCEGQPAFVQVDQVANCTVRGCKDLTTDTSSLVTCTSELNSHDNIGSLFGRAPYILCESYNDKNCSEFQTTEAFNVAINCVKNEATGIFVLTRQENNGSISVQYFLKATCSSESLHSVDYASKEALENHLCDASTQQWYMSVANDRALELMVDSFSVTDTTLDIDTPSVTSTSLDGEDSSATGVENTETLTSTGSSNTSDKSSSTDTFESDAVTNTSETVDRTMTSSDSSSNDDETGSSFESGRSRSSTVESQGSRVSITTAPELDIATVASSTGSVHENVAADAVQVAAILP